MRNLRLPRWLAPIRESAGVSRTIFWIGVGIVAFFVILAVFAPIIAPYGFDQVSDPSGAFPEAGIARRLAPLRHHRRQLRRAVAGRSGAPGRRSRSSSSSVVFSLAIGVPLGLFSGYFGGWIDRVLVLIMDAMFAFPYLLLAIVIAFLLSDKLGQGVLTAAIAITAVYVPQYFRVVRNHVISIREEPYVEAARALGANRVDDHPPLHTLQNVVQNVPRSRR